MPRSYLPLLSLLMALIPGSGARAVEPGAAVSFPEALQRAAQAPLVRGARQAVAAKGALDARISAMPFNPQIGVLLGYRALAAPERGVEGQLNLMQPFNLAGLSQARRHSAQAERQVLAAELRAVSLAQRLGAAQAWLTLWGAQEALLEAHKEVALAEELARRTERAAAAALLTRGDAAEARAYLAEAELSRLTLEGEAFELGIELARLLGGSAASPLRAAGPPPDPPPPSAEALPRALAGAEQLPEAQRGRLLSDAEQARERELRASRGVQLQLGAQLVRESPQSLIALGSVTVIPPLFDRGERERAVLAASQARLEGEAEALAAQARAGLAVAFHEVTHSGEVLEQIGQRLVPASAETARLREAALVAGQATVLEVILARRGAALARGRRARALAAHTLARARLWLLLAEMSPAAPQGGPR